MRERKRESGEGRERYKKWVEGRREKSYTRDAGERLMVNEVTSSGTVMRGDVSGAAVMSVYGTRRR
jgi:hypothetical protein